MQDSTMKTIFSSPRMFSVFSYAMPHGGLLLRSAKTPANPTRVDILFQDVRAMEIRASFDGIRIEECDRSFLKQFGGSPIALMEEGKRAYRLQGHEWQGYILGGMVLSHEDQGELLEPSQLLAA